MAKWKQDATSPLIVRLPFSKVKAKERQVNSTGTATCDGTTLVELTRSSLRAVRQWARNGESLADVLGSKFSAQGLGYGIRMSWKARTKEIRAWRRSLNTGLVIVAACGDASTWVLWESCGDRIWIRGFLYGSQRVWDPGGRCTFYHGADVGTVLPTGT